MKLLQIYVCLLVALLGSSVARGDDVTVFAAASMKNALDEVSVAFTEVTNHVVTASYAGSSILARQIELGAPADVFISANPQWMDYLEKVERIDAGSRFDLLGNSLVLIAREKPAEPVVLNADLDLAGMLSDRHLAMALVDAVPVGVYGKAALISLGLWSSIAAQVVQADNARAALTFVASGEAPFGIVYATDASVSDEVELVGSFPASSHPPIVYPAAAVAERNGPAVLALLDFLRGDAARAIFARHGFRVQGE